MHRQIDINQNAIAIVLAAGLGTRLTPITQIIPKPIVPILGGPLAFHQIRRLLQLGFKTVHCNTHHLADDVKAALEYQLVAEGFPIDSVRFWHETELLNTGGGIGRIASTLVKETGLERDALVVSGDIFGCPDMNAFVRQWQKVRTTSFAMMATLPCNTPRSDVTWAQDERIVSFHQDLHTRGSCNARVFSTFQFIGREILTGIAPNTQSSIDIIYRSGLRKGLHLYNYDYANHDWYDIGTLEAYAQCLRDQGCVFTSDHAKTQKGEVHILSPLGFALSSEHIILPLQVTPSAYSLLTQSPISLHQLSQIQTHNPLPLFLFISPNYSPGPNPLIIPFNNNQSQQNPTNCYFVTSRKP